MSEELDKDIEGQSNRKKYLTWAIIAIVIVAIIAVPLVLMRQSEPTEATEPATIEQLEAEIDALYVTVYGTEEAEGLETKLAEQAELIANIQTGDCICPDWTGQLSSINSDITTLRTDVDAIVVTDYSANITQIDTDLAGLLVELTAVETSLTEIQSQVDAIEVTDWTPDIDTIRSRIDNLEATVGSFPQDITDLQGSVAELEDAISILTIPPRYALVKSIGDPFLEVEVCGVGDYPVIITLYDVDTTLTEEVITVYEVDYEVKDEFLYNGGHILVVIIEPLEGQSWGGTNEVNLVINKLTGGIDYATASVGG